MITSARRAVVPFIALVLVAGACSGSDESPSSAGSTATSSTQPLAPPPNLAGDHPVGRRTVVLTDAARGGRELTVDLWYPADADAAQSAPKSVYSFIPGVEFTSAVAAADVPIDTGGPFPLVIYSHGSGGIRYASSTNAELLASHGFVVAAPDHVGNTAFDVFLGTSEPREQVAIDRPADTAFVITELLDESAGDGAPLSGALDAERIGVYGHSFGGHTALASGSGHGGVPADGRVTAVVGWAPYTGLLTDAELESIDVPTMLLGGTEDITTPIPDNVERPWELIPGRPLYRVDIADAGHQSFGDACDYQELAAGLPDAPAALVEFIDELALEGCTPELLEIGRAHEIIDLYTVAFMLTYVAGDDAAAGYLTVSYAETMPEVAFSVKES